MSDPKRPALSGDPLALRERALELAIEAMRPFAIEEPSRWQVLPLAREFEAYLRGEAPT